MVRFIEIFERARGAAAIELGQAARAIQGRGRPETRMRRIPAAIDHDKETPQSSRGGAPFAATRRSPMGRYREHQGLAARLPCGAEDERLSFQAQKRAT